MMSLMMHQGPGQAPMPPHHQFGSSGNGQQMMQMPAIGAASGPAAGRPDGPRHWAAQPACAVCERDTGRILGELELKRVFQTLKRLMSMCQSGYIIAANGGNLTVCFANRQRIDQGLESYQSATPQTCLLLTFYNVRMDFNWRVYQARFAVPMALWIGQQDGLLRAVLEFEKLEDAVLTKREPEAAPTCTPVMEEYRYDQAGAMMMGGGPPAGKRVEDAAAPLRAARLPMAACWAKQPMNCDRLFNILALYGNVDRIKFVTSREGFALVQSCWTLHRLSRLWTFCTDRPCWAAR
uniref:YTH domain-containing protein n=1 Tax=Macrostomum lignano TaxID=282301 RepID=A0A1I8FLN7_9PLAT